VTIELTLLSQVAFRGQEITSPSLRGLLALLAADLRTGCSTARLVDGLWPDEQPESPTKALQVLVSRARTQLGSDLITTTPAGYRLNLDEDRVDASAVVRHASSSAQHARAGDHAAALAEADAGLALWDSAPVDDGEVPGDPVAELRAERIATYRSLVRSRALALARLGRHAEALDLLTDLFRQRPRDEELLLELLRSEAATTGPAAALTRYEAYRSDLRDELGADPGQPLQAVYQDLLRDTAPTVRRGTTFEPNPLIGRDDDIAAVEALLHSSRVTSIVGPGGLGKTRLAQSVWRRAEHRVGYFVALAGVTTGDEVIAEVAAAVGAGESAGPHPTAYAHDLLGAVVATVGSGPALLVLDNCEHVLDAAADLVQALVSRTEELRILTTSRASLGLSSEAVYLLPELGLTAMTKLFTQRAQAARPDVDLPPDVVCDICQHLDGLPLAVELAAARVRVMSVAEIAQRLDDRFGLLRGGPRDTPERHRTLRAVVEWSWNLLDPEAQRAMRTLSVLPGGFSADVAGRMLGQASLDTLEQLVEQSMLTVSDMQLGTRFRMLETVREFSAGEREAAGEDAEAVDRLLAWARQLGLEHFEAPWGPDPYPSVDLIRAEQENLTYAMRQALDRGDASSVAATAGVLCTLWVVESNFQRISSTVEETSRLLSHYRPEPEFVEITRTALVLSGIYTFLLEGPRAVRALVGLRRLPPASPDTFAGAASIISVSALDDPETMYTLAASEHPLVAAAANAMVSYDWETQNDIDQALVAAHRILEAVDGRGWVWLESLAHSRIGELAFQMERGDDARHHLAAALPVFDRIGSTADAIGIRWWIVMANLQVGDVDEAERWIESMPAGRMEKLGISGYDIGARAEAALARGQVETGLELWRSVVDLVHNIKDPETGGVPIGLEPWVVESRVVTVVAHAQHGRLDLVSDVPEELRKRLKVLLTVPIVNPPPYIMGLQLSGSILLALAFVALDHAQRVGDGDGIRSAVRQIALAERFGYPRNFQPTMASAGIRQTALDADRSAYEEAVSSYADLDRDGLRAAAVAMLR